MDTINRNAHQERATSQVLESEKGSSGSTLKIGLLLIISFAIAMPAQASLCPGDDDLDALLDGVAEIATPGVPSAFFVYGPESFPVIVGAPRNAADAVRAPVIAAGCWQAGRVVALGHKGYFNSSTLEKADTARLMANAFAWVSGGGASASPRIGVVGNAQLRAWLTRTGHDVVEASLTSESLGAVDVVAVDMGNQSAPELEALSAFVRAGGGLVTAANGWGWASLHPKLDIINDFAGNRLLAPIGIQWLNSSLKRTSPAGYAVAEPPSELTHAVKAFNAVKAHIAGRRKLTQPEVDQTLYTLARTIRALPPNDVLFAPDLQGFFSNYEGTRWPSAKHPVDESDVVARLVATLFVSEHHRTPPQSVRAHPAATDFPGSVPTDAPRLTRSLIIDTTVPRWHSTGLYAAPGDLVTVTVPTRVANGGFFVRIGAHSDQIWRRPTWKRMPQISYRFPISTSRTRVANAFGGLIYIEVPKKNPGFGRITVEIEGAVAAPLFVLGETDPAVWRAEIRHAPAPWAEIAGRNMIVTTRSSEVRRLDDPTAVAETWDRVLDLAADLAAWPPNTRSSPERFVVDRQISAGSMHSGYPLMAHLNHQSNLVDAEHIRSEGNWGFFHEVGHNHQHKDWTFAGTTEVTVNLFTLYIYEFICGIPMVDGEFPGRRKRSWAALMASYNFDNPTFEYWKKNAFLALIMYAQMQQAFGWDAYRQVFATYRVLPNDERPKSDDEKRDQWLVRFSRTVGRNLGPFFEAWGIPTSKAARDSIADLPVWMPPNFPP